MIMLRITICKYTYCYIYFDSKSRDAVLVDPAWNIKRIERNLSDINLKGIILTHHHIDHVNIAGQIAKKHKIPVYINKTERDYYKFKCHNLYSLNSEELFSIGNIEVKPYHTPGHTIGSTCYLIDKNLFTGDTVFIEGCGICSLKGGSTIDMYNSFQLLRKVLTDEILIYPGHRYYSPPGMSFRNVIRNNIYFGFSDSTTFSNFRNRKKQKIFFLPIPH